MNFLDVSILAIIISAILNAIVGGLWYSPVLFGKTWMKAMDIKEENFDKSGANTGYALSFIGSIITAYTLSVIINSLDVVTLGGGALIGFLAGFGIAAMREVAPTFFESRKFILYVISASYHIVALTLMGMIITAFS